MKRIVLMALLGLALPLSAFASGTVDFVNARGTLSGSNAGLTLSGSTLIAVTGLNGMGLVVGNLGSVSFSTGALMNGSLAGGGMFSGTGSSFVIQGNGKKGVPDAVIFQGSFNGPIKWTVASSFMKGHTRYYVYTFSGDLKGTWMNGTQVSGEVAWSVISKGPFNGSMDFKGGAASINTVPEPGTLGLLGTGLIGLAGLLRRKIKV